MQRANVHAAPMVHDDARPDGYRVGQSRVGDEAGGNALAVRLYELPPGQSVCPYHYEYEEEWLLVLGGAVVVRTPAGEESLVDGDLVCFPPGPAGAHNATNPGPAPARLLMFSSARQPAVAVYPDSDKIGVWPGNPGDEVMLQRADGHAGYWDGEA